MTAYVGGLTASYVDLADKRSRARLRRALTASVEPRPACGVRRGGPLPVTCRTRRSSGMQVDSHTEYTNLTR